MRVLRKDLQHTNTTIPYLPPRILKRAPQGYMNHRLHEPQKHKVKISKTTHLNSWEIKFFTITLKYSVEFMPSSTLQIEV